MEDLSPPIAQSMPPKPSWGDDEESSALRNLVTKVDAMKAQRHVCQQYLALLEEEQESLLRDIRVFARAQGPAVRSTAARVQWGPAPEISGDDAQESSHRDASGLEMKMAQRAEQAPAEMEIADGAEEEEPHVDANATSWDDARPRLQRLHSKSSSWSSERIKVSALQRTQSLSEILATMQGMETITRRTSSTNIRAIAKSVLHSRIFEPAMGFLIIVNAANIGWTIERELANEDTHWNTALEVIMMSVFVAEVALRFFVEGIGCLRARWNLFDALLIATTIAVMVFFEAVQMPDTGSMADWMKSMLVLRVLRLLRLARAMRLITMCRPLWKLVEGLKHCLGTMISALALLGVAIYLFACFGAELITKGHADDAVVGGLVSEHFASLPMIILTLFRFISLDSAASVYVPLIVRSPVLGLYFLLLVVIVSIALMNLITAVVVEDAISTTRMDGEMKRHFLRERLRELRPALKELFRSLAPNENDAVEVPEIVEAIQSGLRIPDQLVDVINPGRMLDFFDLLDQNDDGMVTESEFVEGLSCVAVTEVPLETMQILHVLRSTRREVQLLSQRIAECECEMPTRDLPHPSSSKAVRRSGPSNSGGRHVPHRLTPKDLLPAGLAACVDADLDEGVAEEI